MGKWQPGNMVQLKGTHNAMCVKGDAPDANEVVCCWHDKSKKPQSAIYHEDQLEPYDDGPLMPSMG